MLCQRRQLAANLFAVYLPIVGWELRKGEQCSFAGIDTTDFALENIGTGIAYLNLQIRTVVNYASNERR